MKRVGAQLKIWAAKARFFTAPITLLGSVVFGAIARAQNVGQAPPTTVETPQEVANLLCNFINYFFWFVLIVSIIMILYAAYTYITASDDTEKTAKARRIITYAAIGVVVALIAVGFPSIVSGLFPQDPNANLADACTL